MDCPVWILLAALLGIVWAQRTDKGPQTFQEWSPNHNPKSQPESHPMPKPQPQPQQEYQEVVMYLTSSQIRQLQQTQQEHGMIISTVNPGNSVKDSPNEAIEQYLPKQQQNEHLERQLLRQDPKDIEQYLKQQDSNALNQQLLKEQSRQLKQKYQNLQESGDKKQQLLKEETRQPQQYLKQQASREFEQQLLDKQSRALEQQFLYQQGSKELEPQEFYPYQYLQLQNRTEQKNKSGLNQKLQQIYVVPKLSNSPYKTLAPQILLVPQQELKEEKFKPVVKGEPQLQYVYFHAYRPIPPNESRRQLFLPQNNQFFKPIQQGAREQLPLELKDDPYVHLMLYQYIPEQ